MAKNISLESPQYQPQILESPVAPVAPVALALNMRRVPKMRLFKLLIFLAHWRVTRAEPGRCCKCL